MRVFWLVSFTPALRVTFLTQPEDGQTGASFYVIFLIARRPSE